MHTKRKNLKQRENDVASYTEEFHKLCLRSKVQEAESIKVERYVNGLTWNIQEEIQFWTPNIVQKCYQLALKVEEKLRKKQDFSNRSRGKGIEQSHQRGNFGGGRGKETIPQGDSKTSEAIDSRNPRGGSNQRGKGSNNFRGRSNSQGKGPSYFATMQCYNCNQLGHPSYRCLEKASSLGEINVTYAQEDV